MRRIIFIVLLVFVVSALSAAGIRAVLPYEMVGSKMVVEVELNGVKKKAIFDTGAAKNTITEKLMSELGLAVTSTQKITDVNNNQSDYKKTVIESLQIPSSGVNFKGFDALVIDSNIFECFGVEVLLGSEMFSQTIVEIDHRAKTITITSAEEEPKISLRTARPFAVSGFMPIVVVEAEAASVTTLFDTGYGGFFLLKNEDYATNCGVFKSVAKSITEGSFGLGGKAASEVSDRVLFDRMSVSMGKFRGATVETSASPYSLVGMKLLDHGKVTIDYARHRFYFEPYEKEVIMPAPLNHFGMTVKEGKMVICDVWSSDRNGLKNGDIVTHINGKEVGQLDFCKSVTVGIEELKVKQKTSLTINGKKKIVYYNKK